MHSIFLGISVRAPRDCGLRIGLCIKYFYSLGTDFVGKVLSFSEFIAKRIFFYIEVILFRPSFVFSGTS